MADQDGDDLRDARLPGELFRPTAPARPSSAAAVDLAEALGGLDRATRNFTRRLGEGQREVERARLAGEEAIREAAEGAPRPEVAPMDHEAAEVADPVRIRSRSPRRSRSSSSWSRHCERRGDGAERPG